MENELHAGPRSMTRFDRVRLASQALSDAARRTGLPSRQRGPLTGGGFQARRGALAVRLGLIVSFCLFVAAPTLVAAVYYGWLASDQFVAVANFTVAGGQTVHAEGSGASQSPTITIVQDTQIVANYLQSRAALEKLEEMVDIKALYSTPSADGFARFDPSKPIEKFVAYWKRMSSVSIKLGSGAIEMRVSAFRPEDASRIAQAALTIGEGLINDINRRMNRDAVASAERELNRTKLRLAQSQAALERARNDQGMLDATKAVAALNKLINDTRASLLQAQQDYDVETKSLSDTSPQVRALKSHIETIKLQVDQLEAKRTTTRQSAPDHPTLADAMTAFAALDVENKVAQRLYAGATTVLEAARLTAERKSMYLNIFVKPSAPEEAAYPKRGLIIAGVLAGSLALWGVCCGLALTIRNHMA